MLSFMKQLDELIEQTDIAPDDDAAIYMTREQRRRLGDEILASTVVVRAPVPGEIGRQVETYRGVRIVAVESADTADPPIYIVKNGPILEHRGEFIGGH